MDRYYFVYIMTNKNNTTLYVSMTNDLIRRIREHKNKLQDGFTRKYNISKLVYFEQTWDVEHAMAREEQLKASSRAQKIELVESKNPDWRDLAKMLFE